MELDFKTINVVRRAVCVYLTPCRIYTFCTNETMHPGNAVARHLLCRYVPYLRIEPKSGRIVILCYLEK